MENWELDKEKSLDEIDLSIDLDYSETSSLRTGRILRSRRETQIYDDEKEIENSRRVSVSWKLPEGTPNERARSLDLELGDDSETSVLEIERQYELLLERSTLLERASCSEDVIHVWTNVSRFIIATLKGGRGVIIPGLCTITYQTQKQIVDGLPEYFAFKKIPFIIMSEFVVKRYRLLNKSDNIFGAKAPVIPLSLTEISTMTKLSWRIVEGAVLEVLQTFSRALACNKPIELPFTNIGKLQVINHYASMKFYEQFYINLDFTMEPPAKVAQVGHRPANTYAQLMAIFTGPQDSGSNITGDYGGHQDPNFETIPGHMTPLRKHIPTEDFRSVFHLREVRSVHEDDIDIEDNDAEEVEDAFDLPQMNRLELLNRKKKRSTIPRFGECTDFYNHADWNSFLSTNEVKQRAQSVSNDGGIRKHNTTSAKHANSKHKNHRKGNSGESNIIESYENEGEVHGNGEDYITPRQTRLYSARPSWASAESHQKKVDSGSPSLKLDEHEKNMDPILLAQENHRPQSSKHKNSTDSLQPCFEPDEDAQSVQTNFEIPSIIPKDKNKRPAFYAEPLYRLAPTGKFCLDLILSNPSHFKAALSSNHHSVCSRILGIDVVRKHYQRRGNKGPVPMSYEDTTHIPPSPQ